MKNYLIHTVILLAVILLSVSGLFAAEPIERIIAVVGVEPITASELAAQIQLYIIQTNERPQSQEELEQLQNNILNQMISERLFLIEARKDTLIRVTPEEIENALNEHIARIASQFDTEEAFLDQIAKEGMTLREYRKRLRPEVENQLYKQRLINSKLSQISISRQEVFDFYDKFKDSIPEQPEAVKLAHILVTFQPSGGSEDSVKQLAEKVRQQALAGVDFPTLAAQYSDGPTALTGGDLGFISAEDVVPEFGRVAFNLRPGDISAPVRTEFGIHIIKCEEVSGNQAHLRHILFQVIPTAADSLLSYKLVDSLLNEIKNGTDFRELAKVYSADDDSRKAGGELGWFAIRDLPPSFAQALEKMPNINDVYGPALTEYGLHILKKLDRKEGGSLNPENDFDNIREMARQSKTGEYVDRWLEEMKEKTFVEIRKLD
ncbi:MAG: peptidylprolyl isomerase [Candidatus Zixiibacteriota bacterium]